MSEKETTTPPDNHYVDNNKFYEVCLEYHNRCKLAESQGKPRPRIPEFAGECIWKIANKLSTSRNFVVYPYREEMISDGIENCILYFHNFDPIKYKNPFSYFTQIVYYAFLRRIHKEKKQMYIRHKAMMNQSHEGLAEAGMDGDDDHGLTSGFDTMMNENNRINDFVSAFEEKERARRESRKKKANALSELVEESNDDDDLLSFEKKGK